MEITDYKELNALNKLLGRVKFQSDIDFSEFKEFVQSPFIANIYQRVNDELWQEALKRGHVKPGQKPTFEFNSPAGNTLCKRIDELSNAECETFRTASQEIHDEYLKVLIAPLHTTEMDFDLLRQYLYKKVMTSH